MATVSRRKAAERARAEKRSASKIRGHLKSARAAGAPRSRRRPGPTLETIFPEGPLAGPLPFTARRIEQWPVSRLVPLARNPRVHSDQQIQEIALSIATYGFLIPLVVNLKQRRILAGNGRFAAALRLGLERVPVIVADHLPPALQKAFVVADNAIATHASWDEEILAEYFTALKNAGADAALTFFSDEEIQEILAAARPRPRAEDEEAIPPLPAKAVSKRGDLWLLGSHRVLCGDATNVEDMLRLVDGKTIDCTWTDPPYGVSYEAAAGEIQNDDLPERELAAMLSAALAGAYAVMGEGAPLYLAHADTGGHIFRRVMIETGFRLASCLIWRKSSLVLSRGDYHWQHEPILYGWKPGAAHRWYGDRSRTTILEFDEPPFAQVGDDEWQIQLGERTLVVRGKDLTIEPARGTVFLEEKPAASREHPTMKPVALIDRMLAVSTRPGNRVLDPFAGSGSTLVACETRALAAYALEIEPRYVDVIVQRWQKLTGRGATLAATGRAFEKEAAARRRGKR